MPKSWPYSRGQMADAIAAFDWSATELGPSESWPQSLRSAVDLMLGSAHPVYIAWGTELVSLFNDGYIPILGAKHPGALGQPYARLFDEIWEEFRPIVEATMAGEAHSFVDRPIPLQGRDGLPMSWFTFSWTPLRDEQGEVRGLYCAAFETTEKIRTATQLHAEQQTALDRMREEAHGQWLLYEAILNNTPDLAYVFDLEHRFIYANKVLLEMWGKTWDEAIGKRCIELGYEPWHALMHDREIDQVAATGLPIRGEVPFNGAFGRRIYDYIFVPVFNAAGAVIAVAGTTRDITEMDQMEARLRRQTEQLMEVDRRKDEFLGVLAHELRNPLAPLRNGLEVLKRLQPDDRAGFERINGMMGRQLSHMVRLIDDLLDVTRISRGKIRLRTEHLALTDLVHAAVETSQPALDLRGHQLSVTCAADPIYVHADPTRLAQVVSNLLTNAAKFTSNGGLIQISTERQNGEACITVTDNGDGIASAMLESIFDMFVQGDKTSEREKSGLGIGLSLARGLMALHGGTVVAHSEGLGEGSTFVVRMPLSAAPVLESVTGSAVDSPDQLPPRRVLIADDNVDAAESLATLVECMGSITKVVHNGQDAVDAAETFRPDLVFLDIGMPGLDGYQACARMVAMPWAGKLVLVALTGLGQEQDRLSSSAAGFRRHLVKPVDTEAVKAAILEAHR